MTEQQLEARIERMIDRLDKDLMSGLITQEQYDSQFLAIQAWAKEQEYLAWANEKQAWATEQEQQA